MLLCTAVVEVWRLMRSKADNDIVLSLAGLLYLMKTLAELGESFGLYFVHGRGFLD